MSATKETLHAAADVLGVAPDRLLNALDVVNYERPTPEEVAEVTGPLLAWLSRVDPDAGPTPRVAFFRAALELANLWEAGQSDLSRLTFTRVFMRGAAMAASWEVAEMEAMRMDLVVIASRQDYDSPERALTEAAIRLVELHTESALDLDVEPALRAVVQRALAAGGAS